MGSTHRLAAVAIGISVLSGALCAQVVPSYVSRGRQVEKHQRALNARIASFRDSLIAVVNRVAPDLRNQIDPPPAISPGYQLLPRVIQAAPATVNPPPPELVSFSWRWSDILFDRISASFDSLELRRGRMPADVQRDSLSALVASFRAMIDRKRPVDADVNYNWLWQAEIARTRDGFERTKVLQDDIIEFARMRKLSSQLSSSPNMAKAPAFDSIFNALRMRIDSGLATTVRTADLQAFVTFDSLGNGWRLTVPIYTDISDTSFVNAFERTIESRWRTAAGPTAYSVDVVITHIDPQTLYCGSAPMRPDCSPPARGDTIDINRHVARFPPDAAVITSGAGSTHVAAGRAIVLGPHDITTTVLAHEFGHLLGLRDAYLRGAIDAGSDGFIVTELVVDQADIMGSAGSGSVLPDHFQRVLAARSVSILMSEGLTALYERNNPSAAIVSFRMVLERNPQHYGATVQLAKALEADGKSAAARAQWALVLDMAERAHDAETIEMARSRLRGGR